MSVLGYYVPITYRYRNAPNHYKVDIAYFVLEVEKDGRRRYNGKDKSKDEKTS